MFESITKTNYFRVTNKEKLKDVISRCKHSCVGKILILPEADFESAEHCAFCCYGEIYGIPDANDNGVPSTELFRAELQSILPDGEVIIITCVGYDGLDEVFGDVDIITKNNWDYMNLDEYAKKSAKTMLSNIDGVEDFVKKKAVEAFVATPSDNKEEEPVEIVKSKGTWAPQNYLGLVTGKYYCLKHNQPATSEIRMLLKANKKKLRDYPMDRIDLVVKDKANVILVDVSYYEGDNFITEYRWFEVDCEINQDEWE